LVSRVTSTLQKKGYKIASLFTVDIDCFYQSYFYVS
jgi:hypothetical protein